MEGCAEFTETCHALGAQTNKIKGAAGACAILGVFATGFPQGKHFGDSLHSSFAVFKTLSPSGGGGGRFHNNNVRTQRCCIASSPGQRATRHAPHRPTAFPHTLRTATAPKGSCACTHLNSITRRRPARNAAAHLVTKSARNTARSASTNHSPPHALGNSALDLRL